MTKNTEIILKKLANKLGLGKNITVNNLTRAGFIVPEELQCSENKAIEMYSRK